MKQNIFIAALLAAMLVIAGCGGGSSSTGTGGGEGGGDNGGDPVTKEVISMRIKDCGDADCVEKAIQDAKDGGITGAELAALEGEANTKKAGFAPAGATALAGLEKTQADELLDAIEGSEALPLESSHISEMTAELTNSETWKDGPSGTGPNIGGWTGNSHHIPNPAGSSGRIQDIRYWTEGDVYLSQNYIDFFSVGGKGVPLISGSVNTTTGVVTLPPTGTPAARATFNVNAVPSDFFTESWTWNAAYDSDPDNENNELGRWELKGDFVDVPGTFVLPDALAMVTVNGQKQQANPRTDSTQTTALPLPEISVSNITFHPTNFKETTKVDAKWAKLQNPNFLNFGLYWNTDVTDKDEVTSIQVDLFAGGGRKYRETRDIVLSGDGVLTATYSGGAAGLYVRTMTDDNDDRVATGFGEFTADANFEAKFAGSGKDTLSGTIGNFKKVTGTGADPDSAWEVKLSGDIANGGASDKGDTFNAQFYGNVAPERQSNGHHFAPYGLVGTFQSGVGTAADGGQVSGAFGAECRGSNCTKQN